jgi:hypothetical protein
MNKYDDILSYNGVDSSVGPPAELVTTMNAGETRHRGVEVTWDSKPRATWYSLRVHVLAVT